MKLFSRKAASDANAARLTVAWFRDGIRPTGFVRPPYQRVAVPCYCGAVDRYDCRCWTKRS